MLVNILKRRIATIDQIVEFDHAKAWKMYQAANAKHFWKTAK